MAEEKKVTELKYEEALAELEEVLAKLENGQNSLEDSMELFARGQVLLKYCASLLDNAELQVLKLTQDGTLEELE